MCLATIAYVYAACTVCVTIFSAGSNFEILQLYTFTLATHFYALLTIHCAFPPTHTSTDFTK